LIANAKVRDVDHADVQTISQEHTDGLRTERLASAVGQPPLSRLLQNLLLRIRAGRVVLEQSANDRRPLSLELAIDVKAPTSPKFSILFGEHVGVMFVRVNAKCVYHRPDTAERGRWVSPWGPRRNNLRGADVYPMSDRILALALLGRLQSAERAMPTHDNYAKATNLLSA
jgi:hypothetical protein